MSRTFDAIRWLAWCWLVTATPLLFGCNPQPAVPDEMTVVPAAAHTADTNDASITATAAVAMATIDAAIQSQPPTLTSVATATSTPNLPATETRVAQQIATTIHATLAAMPTATPVTQPSDTPEPMGASTDTPQPMPTDTAPAIRYSYHAIPLGSIVNASTQEGYVTPPLGRVELNGVPFTLPAGQNSVTTQAEPLPDHPTELILSNLQIQSPQQVYLLLTGGNTRLQFEDVKIGEVELVFADQQRVTEELVPGWNLREWKVFGDHNVTWTSAPHVAEVWTSRNNFDSGTGIIDLLTMQVPADLTQGTLVEIRIRDQSLETAGSMDPAINLLGVTVLGQE